MRFFKKLLIRASFSLVELSIVITIIAIISGAVLSVASTKTDMYRIKQTQEKLDVIEKALAAYVRLNFRLPCPGDITLTPSHQRYGVEKCGCETSALPLLNNLIGFNCSTKLVTGGMVPINTLNLPKEFAVDGWGNKIVYNVMKAMTANEPGCTYATPTLYATDTFSNCSTGLINMNNGSAYFSLATVYVLRSFGPNGYYATRETSSSQNGASTDVNEIKNKDIVPTVFYTKPETSSFDDIVRYKEKWQIVKEAGGQVATPACIYAKTVLETSDLQANNNFYSPYCKTQPASPECDSALITLSTILLQEMCLNK